MVGELAVEKEQREGKVLQRKEINVQFASDIPNLPALFMVGREPFSAQSRFPPKGIYC